MGTPMDAHLVRQHAPFAEGYTAITRIGEACCDTGIGFGILRIAPGGRFEQTLIRETALLLMDGRLRASAGEASAELSRQSVFDQAPEALHAPRGVALSVVAATACELAVFEVENDRHFPPAVYHRGTLMQIEQRGKGMLEDAAHRVVRTVFDTRNRPESNLVLGDVVTLPGRWSSYPPHHHPQPEIYHYRFDHPAGFGFSELGEEVVRLRHGDTLKIPPGADHAQVAAPGYAMYYLWAIRHLPGNPYITPEFTEAHRWLLEPGVAVWRPKEDAHC